MESHWDVAPDQPIHRLRMRDARVFIAREVGVNATPRTPLDKHTLNSLYAYLTGEFIVTPEMVLHPKSPNIEDVRYEVAMEMGFRQFPDPAEELKTFRLGELRAIAKWLRENPDQREWTP